MKTKGKILLVSLCAALLVSAGAVGSLAFFTDTDSVENKFTVGDIQIELDEAKTDEMGVEADPEVRVDKNTYKLLPGHEYAKDPIVHIEKTSEKCYVFVAVKNEIAGIEDPEATIEAQMGANKWVALGKTLNGADVYVYDTNGTTAGTIVDPATLAESTLMAGYVDLPVFENFKVDGARVTGSGQDPAGLTSTVELSEYNGKTVVVTAYAVQADGFASAEQAWANTFGA